jgi:hypothetical protein
MAYTRGNSNQIIVGAAAFFIADSQLSALPHALDAKYSYRETLSANTVTDVVNVGYTTNGLELAFAPNFGEVSVDQILDVAKLYKQGMKVDMKTEFAEATLENLLIALAYSSTELDGEVGDAGGKVLNLSAGQLGECPVERGIIAVGPGSGDCVDSALAERIYVGFRALSIDNVSVMAKRDAPSMFAVNFRMLPIDSGTYGKIIDRTFTTAGPIPVV